jgi:hypothetical protein
MKPPRPFGLTLAILTAWLLFTIVPLVISMIVFYINSYVYKDPETGGVGGLTMTNFQSAPYIFVMMVAILFAFVGVFAWRGRPRQMRFVFPAFVVAISLVTVLGIVIPSVTATPTLQQGIDSSQDLARRVLSGYSGATIVCAMYTLWFCNRWSARAFFRGYYLDKDREQMTHLGMSASGTVA